MPVVALTAEQSSILNAAGPVELRDDAGKTLGYFVVHPDITLFYTPQQLDELRRRGADRNSGRTFQEILAEVEARL